MPRIFIVTEGGRGLGFGHITRCLSLYQAFKEQGITPEFIINGDETIRILLRSIKYQIFNWQKEKDRFVHLIESADIVIMDSYLVDSSLCQIVSQVAKVSVYIDDDKRLSYPRGFIINGNIYAEELDYPKQENIKYLLGFRYAFLRKEFWDIPEKEVSDKVGSVMITFGGYDGSNMTSKILKVMNEKYDGLTKNVILGKGFQNIDKIEELKNKSVNLIYNPDAQTMKKMMMDSDIAISAGGQTLYEFARVGIPTIGICVAKNQQQNLEKWKSLGFIEYIGWHGDEKLLFKLAESMEAFSSYETRVKCSKIGRNLIDGGGARRIIRTLLNKQMA
jgi:UDP-2,4-diacetamido-2,4,6-trideoxy-beta-L-altropyranose hydrolase